MATHVPVVSHLRLWSLLADIAGDVPACSKYRDPAVPAGNSTRFNSQDSSATGDQFGFRSSVPNTVNLTQFEIILRASKLVDWLWQPPRDTTPAYLRMLLQSGILLKLTLDDGVDISKIEVDNLLTSHVKKKWMVSGAISDSIAVTAFLASDLITLRLDSLTSRGKHNTPVCTYRRRSKKSDEFDSQLAFNADYSFLVYSFAPKAALVKRWLPKRQPGPASWTVEVYSCNLQNEQPLQRLHKLESQQGDLLLRTAFISHDISVFALVLQSVSPDTLGNSLIVHRHTIDRHSTRLVSATRAPDAFHGQIISSDIHLQSGHLALGLDDHSIILFDDRMNEYRRGSCDVKPQLLRWNADRTLLAVGSGEASFEIFDRALQVLPAALINDAGNYTGSLRLRSCLNSISPLVQFNWVRLSPTDGNEATDVQFSSALLLYFERGPIGIVCFGTGDQPTSASSVLHYWLSQRWFTEAARFWTAIGHDVMVGEVTAGLRRIFTAVIAHDADRVQAVGVMENLLDWLTVSHSARDLSELQALQACYSTLLRRFFGYLVRYEMYERASRLASSCDDPRFHKMLKNTNRPDMIMPESRSADDTDLPASNCNEPVQPVCTFAWTDLGEI